MKLKQKNVSFHEVEIKFLVRSKPISVQELARQIHDTIMEGQLEEDDLEVRINGFLLNVEGKPI